MKIFPVCLGKEILFYAHSIMVLLGLKFERKIFLIVIYKLMPFEFRVSLGK